MGGFAERLLLFLLGCLLCLLLLRFLGHVALRDPQLLAQCKSTFDLHELRIHHNCKIDTPRFEQGKRASRSRDHGEVVQPRGAESLAGGGRRGDRRTDLCSRG